MNAPIDNPEIVRARQRAESLLAPISADARAGKDARDDPRAELLRDEMLKDEYGKRAWTRVEMAAEGLLTTVTKDLVIAACWAGASFETGGLPGLAAGLALLEGLLQGYWDEMFPPVARRKARENALDNFYQHIGTRLAARPVADADDAPALQASAELLEALHAAAQTRYSPPPPHRVVRDELARLLASVPQVKEPESEPVPVPVVEAAPPVAAAPPPPPRPKPAVPADGPKPAPVPSDSSAEAAPKAGASVEELLRGLGVATQHLPKIASGLRRQQPADPLAYRVLRISAWLRAAPPVADAQGRAAVDPLLPTTRSQCEAMARSGRWAELLDASESAFAAPTQRWSLDLQRYTTAALAGLGHTAARTAVLAELAALLRRHPELPRLLARDGTPLADAETQALLAAEALTGAAPAADAWSFLAAPDLSPGPGPAPAPNLSPGPASAPTPNLSPGPGPAPTSNLSPGPGSIPNAGAGAAAPAGDPDLDAILVTARQRLAAGDRPGALAHVQRAAEAAGSPRERFERRTAVALLSLEAGLLPVARAQLAALEREASERRLADWEPRLVARVLAALLASLRGSSKPADAAERERVFDLLCVLDPAAAASQSAR